MYSLPKLSTRVLLLLALSLVFSSTSPAQKEKDQKEKEKTKFRGATPVLWRDPGDVAARNLRYGPGSPRLAPVAPFRFVEEDKSGESPKFEVRDARNVKWVVKLGEEAQSETVSTRLVWAVGYFAEEAYSYDLVRIRNLPKLSRGRKFVEGNSIVRGARFEPRRGNVERGPAWDWDKKPVCRQQGTGWTQSNRDPAEQF